MKELKFCAKKIQIIVGGLSWLKCSNILQLITHKFFYTGKNFWLKEDSSGSSIFN